MQGGFGSLFICVQLAARMNPPIPINFDWTSGLRQPAGTVHLLKIYQGAPYDQSFRVQNANGSYIRDFTVYDEIRMQARLSQGKPALFTLSRTAGTIIVTTTDFRIAFPAALTESISLCQMQNAGAMISEIPFVHDIELMQSGVVVERFAQGTGYIVANTTRAT
jgi:hypothetical protein